MLAGDLADGPLPVDRGEQIPFLRVDRQIKVGVGVGSVDQYRRSAGWQALLDTDGIRHRERHVIEPPGMVETDRLGVPRQVVPEDDGAMPDHGAAEELHGCVAFIGWQPAQQRLMGRGRQRAALMQVRRLPQPAPELQTGVTYEVEHLRH